MRVVYFRTVHGIDNNIKSVYTHVHTHIYNMIEFDEKSTESRRKPNVLPSYTVA